jgi:hypothetical protein
MNMTTRKLPVTLKHEVRFTVCGSGTFPFDMLRYDACHPAGEQQSALLFDHHDEWREVELIHYSEVKSWEPTVERWRSFGWDVSR